MGTKGSNRSAEPFERGVDTDARGRSARDEDLPPRQKKRGWREIEAWRERKFLRDSLAEIWDDDLLVDESMFSGEDGDVAFYTDSEDLEVEEDLSDFDDEGFFEDED